ncbi:MAG: family 10 glycosylhydrolase [Clostridiales bacterium]|nr:family 10 glycosylhydrolase [Clostridiales bacterium]
MMKTAKKSIILLLLATFVSLPFAFSARAEGNKTSASLRGIWISTVLNLDYPSSPTTSVTKLKNEAISALDFAKSNGFNAVFLQVRPCCDAIYPSKIYPWSIYLTGTQGKAPENNFDPLAFYVTEAHKRGLALHAWINPFRVSRSSFDLNSLALLNPARKHPSWTVKGSDGYLYFDPGIPEVRQLVIDGALEIIKNYNIDGIHLDDYFYPSKNFNDAATFKKYGAASKSIDDYRRNNVNLLIKNLNTAIKKVKPSIIFGVSPSGIWANKSKLSDGSNTDGSQSYFDDYADSKRWVKEKWIDYIAPEIYWNIGYEKADYETLVKWWNDVVEGTGVKLYVGQAGYRWINAAKDSPWYGTGELTRQLSLNRFYGNISGSIFFRLGTIRQNAAITKELKDFFTSNNQSNFFLGRPATDIQTTLNQFYITGTSNPKLPLLLNGKEIENRSASGYFGILVPLKNGINNLMFTQGTQTLTRVIYCGTSNSTPKSMSTAAINKTSVFPQSQELMEKTKTVALSCIAPAGSKVTVTVNGKTFKMKQAEVTCPKDGKIYEARFSYDYSLPSKKDGLLYLGSPVYTMNLNGKTDTVTAPKTITVAYSKVPLLAEVTADVADTYPYPNASLGADGPLYRSMRDYVKVITGDYVKLSSGKWIKKANVKFLELQNDYRPQISSATYITSPTQDILHVETTLSPSALLEYKDGCLTVSFPTLTRIIRPELPNGSLCSAIKIDLQNTSGSYKLSFSNINLLGGYYIKPTSPGFDLVLRRKPSAKTSNQPLTGITIMLDAGHGGSENGAIGPMGKLQPEKNSNLSLTLKLKNELELYGATVLLTRESDTTVSLYQRLNNSREKLPNLFLSLHANSLDDNIDISKHSGASVYYREEWVSTLAQRILKSASTDISRSNDGTHIKPHYITKATWTPSLILETGYLPNPQDFEWIINPSEQTKLAQSLAKCIKEYFSS